MPTCEPGEAVMLAFMLVALGVTVANWRRVRGWSCARLAGVWFGLWLLASALSLMHSSLGGAWLEAAEHTCHALAAMLVLFAIKNLARAEGGAAS